MRVLIVENELYLAQSISHRLGDLGYVCDIVSAVGQIEKNASYDVVLLSSAVADFERVIEEYKKNVVIMLISYISMDTVVNPMKAGASDYIQKPFMIEELIRKIQHQQEYKLLVSINKAYLGYIDANLSKAKLPHFDFKKLKAPLLLQAYKQINADVFMFSYIRTNKMGFCCVELKSGMNLEKIFKNVNKNILIYCIDFQNLKLEEQEKLIALSYNQNIFIHSSQSIDESLQIRVIDLSDKKRGLENNEIFTIDEYVKYVIENYQNSFADTDLAAKLGISRKSLWEKRKKYGLTKKR